MSSAARWSLTATATLWPLQARDAWAGSAVYGAPEPFKCDYSENAQTMRDDKGDEYTSRLTIYTERTDIKRGDRVAIGDIETVDPIAAGAREVRSVLRYGDTLDRKADDYQVGTI